MKGQLLLLNGIKMDRLYTHQKKTERLKYGLRLATCARSGACGRSYRTNVCQSRKRETFGTNVRYLSSPSSGIQVYSSSFILLQILINTLATMKTFQIVTLFALIAAAMAFAPNSAPKGESLKSSCRVMVHYLTF